MIEVYDQGSQPNRSIRLPVQRAWWHIVTTIALSTRKQA